MNKPDTWYVQKGVELADGWSIDEIGLVKAPFGVLQPVENMVQGYKDALAAQLVRQVDALDDYTVEMDAEVSYVCPTDNYVSPQEWIKSGPDRTMNTIRAIVDSKVLEGE